MAGYRVLITGASSGIGRGLARALAPGNKLLVTGRSAERLAEVAAETDAVQFLAGDITECIEDLAQAAASLGTSPLVLVLNAGVFASAPLNELSTPTVEESLKTNLLAPILLTKAVWPDLSQHGGKLIVISSIAARECYPGSTVYGATKAGLSHFARTLRLECPPNVSIHLFEPGAIDTPLWEHQSFRPEDMRSVEDFVNEVLTDSGLA